MLKSALGWVEGQKGMKKELYGARGETRDVGGLWSPAFGEEHSEGNLDHADEESIMERKSFLEKGWGLISPDGLESECVSVRSVETRGSGSMKQSSEVTRHSA